MTHFGARKTAAEVVRVVERIRPLLAGHQPEVQGAALADLLATWLAGHVVPSDREATEALRERLLAPLLDTVRALVPVNEAMLRERHGAAYAGSTLAPVEERDG